jgi:chromosomal replication initiator protein
MQTFSGWVSLPENRSAQAAVERVAQAIRRHKSRVAHNPLILHGPAGTGKTHLVHALIAHATLDRPDLTVVLFSARELIPAGVLDANPVDGVRTADLVVVEDLQNLPAAAVEVFVQLVDRCRARGQQLIVTCAIGPAQLDRLPGRLSTRLSAGLVVRLLPLSPSSRLAFLLDRVQRFGQSIASDVLEWLALHLPGSARQLEAALGKVETLARLSGKPLNEAEVAGHFQPDLDPRRLSVESIAQRVGGYFRVAPDQLQSRSRGRLALVPRQIGMYLARRLTRCSLQEIGSYFGGRDHSTVLHACRKVEEALTHDAALSGAVHQLQADLG